ncbi:MAG: hypothetical protein LUG92_03285 [Oscillospiraceae bacterium]|nr:hypothetical protein [Oscillospiraceae bacterium]
MKRTDRFTIITSLIIFLAFLCYAGYALYGSITDATVTAEAVAATVEIGGQATGIIVRDETMLTSDGTYIDVTAADGERVGVGQQLATAMSSQTGLERANRIHELELEIERVSAALSELDSAEELTARDDSVNAAVLGLTSAVARGELTELESLSLALSSLVFASSGETVTQSDLDALETELAGLRSSSSADTVTLAADSSGLFTSVVDGWEHITPDDLTGLTPSGLQELIDSGNDIAEGAYGKLVKGIYWYFAADMSATDAANLTAGEYAALDFGRYYGDTVYAEVVSISSSEGGEVTVVFRCNTALAETLALREVSAEVVFDTYSGIRVPAEAIRADEETDSTYVYVITAMQVECKDIEILYAGDGYCIVECGTDSNSLREGNTIIVSGKDIYEGKVMD